DRVLHQVLGRGEVAEQRDQRRGQPPGVLAHHPREHLLVRRLTHQIGRISTMGQAGQRSEEHTSELQSRENLVCRLLLGKKNTGTFGWEFIPESLSLSDPYAPIY